MDLGAAYCQIHANAMTTSTCIAIVDKLDFIFLWLSFVTMTAPGEYITISKTEIYPGNDLLRDESWDTTDLKSPHRSLFPE